MENPNDVFLIPSNLVNWDPNAAYAHRARELTEGMTTDAEKVQAIQDFIISHLAYDQQLAADVIKNDGKFAGLGITEKELYDLTAIYESGFGICSQYTALFNGMLRAIGIPAKYVTGYVGKEALYHAWSEVYIDGQWVIIDTTAMSTAGNSWVPSGAAVHGQNVIIRNIF
jgi:transglutaminase/protease-like cytokinesis protein 3